MTPNALIPKSGLTSALTLLEEFSKSADFLQKIQLAYGEHITITAEKFNQILSELPSIEMLPSDQLEGARGAYAKTTNQIYLSSELLEGEIDEVVSVLLEEIGHYLDSHLNVIDAPGDEGAIFSAVVQGKSLTSEPRFLTNLFESLIWR